MYGAIPPVTVIDPLPLHKLQVEFTAPYDAVRAAGSLTSTIVVAIQPFASVTSTLYEPAVSPLAVEPVLTAGAHKYV